MPRDPNRRQNIISGASQLFLAQGYDGVTVDEICKITNSAKGSFYHFFQSKEELAIQLVDEVWHQTQARMQSTFSMEKEPLERIRDELEYTYRQTPILNKGEPRRTRQITGCPIGTLSDSLGRKSEKIRKRINFAYNHMRHFYLTAFAQALDNGDIDSELDASQLADLLLVTIQGIGIIGRNSNNQAKIRKLVKNIMQSFTG